MAKKKAAIKKATPKKVAKKSPPKKVATVKKKVPKKPIMRFGVVLFNNEAIHDEITYKVGDTIQHKPLWGNEYTTTIIGIYTDGKSFKYHLSNGIYAIESELIPF